VLLGVEVSFRKVPGVTARAAGYLGGTLASPSYEDVCTGRTGHPEVVEVAAIASKDRWSGSGRFSGPIVTEITPASTFYRAEEYHQRYLEKHGQASCHIP
jgi:peptide-methionine (S)-S-oxide reductase